MHKRGVEGETLPSYDDTSIRTEREKTYYYDLASIAINYSKAFKKEHELKRGWDKTPQKTDGDEDSNYRETTNHEEV